jgi:hypothetical protein
MYYIGIHQTENLNDGYMGSGHKLKKAFKKYGKENFHKEILHILDTKEKMALYEKILVVPDNETNYNLVPGGYGGWNKGVPITAQHRQKLKDFNLGRKHTEATKIKMRRPKNKTLAKLPSIPKPKIQRTEMIEILRQANKSRFWVTNGKENIRIKQLELDIWIDRGYKRGRTLSRDPVKKTFIGE